ncbi:putative uncharacterized protein [Streptomyces azureus]|uniref:Uncharacterized protein n=1 Tax=Streptomyces azureus TaxID=146537 RepID=A0A0K8PQM3_STRAJ|nr:putative uncharacterized protein [Streptomyces azureus]
MSGREASLPAPVCWGGAVVPVPPQAVSRSPIREPPERGCAEAKVPKAEAAKPSLAVSRSQAESDARLARGPGAWRRVLLQDLLIMPVQPG